MSSKFIILVTIISITGCLKYNQNSNSNKLGNSETKAADISVEENSTPIICTSGCSGPNDAPAISCPSDYPNPVGAVTSIDHESGAFGKTIKKKCWSASNPSYPPTPSVSPSVKANEELSSLTAMQTDRTDWENWWKNTPAPKNVPPTSIVKQDCGPVHPDWYEVHYTTVDILFFEYKCTSLHLRTYQWCNYLQCLAASPSPSPSSTMTPLTPSPSPTEMPSTAPTEEPTPTEMPSTTPTTEPSPTDMSSPMP